MKVFTVGLDQKPVEKSDSPPPGYASGAATPLPMGPEIAPIIVRKSRGYKGILMVMLAVFLMAVFALTLSEIAYNRQRDENFFRLQWAQLKHRLGYEHPNRIIPINHGGAEFPEVQSLQQQKPDQLEDKTEQSPKIFIEPSSASRESASSASSEQPNFSDSIRDARLQFLRQILQRIKQNAEQMGFDGTMQVSVIEVEPQQMAELANGGKKSPSEDPRSDAFLDSFGEFHAPPPFGVNAPQPPSMRELNENSIVSQSNGRWPQPDFGTFEIPMSAFQPQQINIRPEQMGFRQPEWSFQQPQSQDGLEWTQPRHMNAFEIPTGHKGDEFGSSPSREVMGEIYGRKFGRMLQDLISARIQNSLMQQHQPMMQNLAMPMRPSFPIEQQPQGWWSEPQQNAMPQAQQSAQPQMSEIPQQPEKTQQESANVPQSQQPNQAPMQLPEHFGQNFPQPQFPVFVSPEDRIQIEPTNGGASWQPPSPQQSSEEKPQMPPHAILDFMPPRAWTHQSESAQMPSRPIVDSEISPPAQSPQQPVEEPHENRIVILKKQSLDGEKHEEFGASQLSDLPLKELQGQLAAALTAQQQKDLQERQERFDEEVKAKLELQRPQEADLFKSIEQTSQENQQGPPQVPSMVEIPEESQKQQPVEPAPLTNEHNQEETTEQTVDFPAVKFPNNPSNKQQADAPHQPEQGGIFFQVDEPHQHQNMAGFA